MVKPTIFKLLSWQATLSALVILLSIPSGCSKKSETPLRIGINSWPGYEFLYLAQEKGFYREESLDVKLLEFNSLSDARRAYERGQIDGLGTSVIDILQARESSARSPQVVQVIDYSNGADTILAQTRIKDGSALRGSHIGVEFGSLGIYVLARGLETFGLTLADVKLISLDQISMEEALSQGTLDAIVSYPPTSIKLLRDAKVKTLFDTSDIPGEVVDVIAVDEQIINQRTSEVSKLLRAYQKAVQYTQQNPDEAYRIMSAREGITVDEFRKSMHNGMHIVTQAEQAGFLMPGGKLEKVIDMSDRILRLTGQINGPDRRTDLATDRFVINGELN